MTLLQSTFIAEHNLDIGNFRFYRNFVVGRIREGTQITLDNAIPVMAIGVEYYNQECPAVYLSDRTHSYSIDPTLHLEVGKLFPFLLGYGVVVYDDLNERVARLEQRFVRCPSGIFRSMDQAFAWTYTLIEGIPRSRAGQR